jgi:DNA-binding NtrC family response regulator
VADREDLAAVLARQTAELQILQRVAAEINATLDLEEIYDIALRTMDDLFEFHHAIILLLEPGSATLRVVASRGYENQAIGGRVPVGVGAVGIVAQRRKILQMDNLGQQRAYASAQRRQLMKAGRGVEIGDVIPVPGLPNAECQIAIPLMIRDELIGVFSIESPVRQAFDEHARSLVTIVANQIASAIRNAQLYDERRRAAEQLQLANASLEMRVAERTAALERELRAVEDLLSHVRSRVDGPLVGESVPVRALREAVAREASRTEPLLLIGPPGAGKEAVAHALHSSSGRKGAFIFVSCPELQTSRLTPPRSVAPERSLDGTLASKLELASGGTLFLDAVHELPLEHQRELQEILERQQGTRAGGEQSPPDARIIASTTLESQGGGSIILLLAKHQVSVPALKDRLEDIPALVEHFVHRHARRFGKPVEGVSPESMRRLETYLWPGNIRELDTVLERAVLVAKGAVLEIDEESLDDKLAVGSYRLISRLGSGGMGEVWLAKHRLLARPAAVKLIRQVAPGDEREQLVRRLEREAHVTARLRSPHTVQLYDFGVNDTGSFYYVMELLQGLDLQDIVNRFGPQNAERVIALLRQACRSLAEAHEHGLVHRDIKPANLFVARLGNEYDHLKVLDFGIVKDLPGSEGPGASRSTLLTAPNLLQGTPAFMAPEVIFGDGPLDGRTDLYSLACAAYWALTGQLVFEGTTAAQMLLHHAHTPPVLPSAVSELPIPADLEAVLMQCLEKNPDKRPSSARELDARLAGIRCPEPWTEERARAWWETHAPEAIAP